MKLRAASASDSGSTASGGQSSGYSCGSIDLFGERLPTPQTFVSRCIVSQTARSGS